MTPQQRVAEAIRHLAESYTDDDRQVTDTRAGLVEQLTASLGSAVPGWQSDGSGRASKPHSKPPGWRLDVSQLLVEIHDDVVHFLRDLSPGVLYSSSTRARLTKLGALSLDDTAARDVARSLERHVGKALVLLGYEVPRRPLRSPCPVCVERAGKAVMVAGAAGGDPELDQALAAALDATPLRASADGKGDVFCVVEGCVDEEGKPTAWSSERLFALLYEVERGRKVG